MGSSYISRRTFMKYIGLSGASSGFSIKSKSNNVIRNTPLYAVKDAKLYVQGEAVFPFGFYFEHAGNLKTHLDGLHDIKTLGFNLVFISVGDRDKSLDELSEIYDVAHDLGLWVIAEQVLTMLENGKTAVEELRHKPSCIAWSVGDDVMDQKSAELKKRADRVHALDPDHLIYASSNGVQRNQRIKIEDFLYCGLDVMAVQAYPVPSPRHWWNQEPGVKDIRLVYYRCARVVRAYERVGKLPMCNPQVFKWWFKKDDRYPNAAETDNMLYQCIIAGIKGILAYTYKGLQPNMRPVWANLAREVQQISPYLLHGQRYTLTLDPSFDTVLSAFWEYKQKRLIIAVNCSDKKQSARIPLPGFPKTGTVCKVFRSRPDGLVIDGGFLRGELDPLDVHIYEMDI